MAETQTAEPKTVLSWSGGKDAAYALFELGEVTELLTSVGENGRSSMHGVRRELYDAQAEALGIPIRYVELPMECSNEEYESRMAAVMAEYETRGIERVAFADLFLENIRAYRTEQLGETGIEGSWPVWNPDTDEQIRRYLDAGFRATVVTVDGAKLDASFVGRELDESFLAAVPDGVDPCGENGEFHTFVWDGPTFDSPLSVEVGETVTKEVGDGEYHYCDLY
ncbi:ATP-binding protein [Haladaptatus sp. CMAA 1911]|uniref:Dph6-related ATP pyrophosphatase n=1 Tax=unclassified Haladaptatus TaxID=2622732 RepID=UPI003754380D